MSLIVNDIIAGLERIAPPSLAEEWDNVGLQSGSRTAAVDSILVTLNVSDDVIAEASRLGCSLIITHHPLIFAPLLSASEDSEAGRLLSKLQREGIALIAAHTNLDSARRGLAHVLAELMGLRSPKALVGADAGMSKLVAFVPESELEQVRAAIFDTGAGAIGDYEHCSWSTGGQGTFLPTERAHPAVGERGREEKVAEQRLEMIFPSALEASVVQALVRTHSYEEPAYDVYQLRTRSRQAGIGRVGDFDAETPLIEVAGAVAELCGVEHVRITGKPNRHIRRVALVPGSGAEYISHAAAENAEVLISGDFKYHHALQASASELSLIDVPHDAMEVAALENWLPLLQQALDEKVDVHLSGVSTDPWQIASRRERAMLPDTEQMLMHHLHVDGGSRGNPGPAGIGAVLIDPNGERLDEISATIGNATNNVAEYQALIAGLEMAIDRGARRLSIFSDSELMVRQIEGRYRVKNDGLRPFFQQAKVLLSRLEEYEIKSVPRESNAEADRLVNQALDGLKK